jgi:hypothetical protein
MAENTNALAMAQQQFDQVADLLGLDHQIREILRWPMREYHIRTGETRTSRCVWMMGVCAWKRGTTRFQGYRVQHSDARVLRLATALYSIIIIRHVKHTLDFYNKRRAVYVFIQLKQQIRCAP